MLPPPVDMTVHDDDVYEAKHKEEENNLVATSVVNAFQQQAGQAKLQAAEELTEDVQDITVKACLMALTKNSKKLEAQTKMLSASKILSRGDAGHDAEDVAIATKMLHEGASLYLQVALKDLYFTRKTQKLKEEQIRLRNEGASLVIQSKTDMNIIWHIYI